VEVLALSILYRRCTGFMNYCFESGGIDYYSVAIYHVEALSNVEHTDLSGQG